MLTTVKIPPALLSRLEAWAAECAGMNRNELILPDSALVTECREAIWAATDHTTRRPHGNIYISLEANTLSQATLPKLRVVK